MGGGLLSLSLSLSLSRCSHLWHAFGLKFKGLFYSFYRKFFLFHRSFNSSFCLQKAFFRTLCFFEIFKCFIYALLRPFCHFERGEKSKEFKIRFVYGYFANAQYDSKAKIQIFYSKFKAFHKFNSFCKFKAFHKFNSFYNFISNFKPYTRLFHIFTPSFCSVQTDKKFFTRRTLCLNRNL